MFPEGIRYNRENDDYRTTRINLLFSGIPSLARVIEGSKKGNLINFDQIPTSVGPLGIEPSTY